MSLDSINETLTGITGRNKPIAQNLAALIQDVRDSYQAITEKGGTVPTHPNTQNLPPSIEQLIEES